MYGNLEHWIKKTFGTWIKPVPAQIIATKIKSEQTWCPFMYPIERDQSGDICIVLSAVDCMIKQAIGE
jgi:hypothetical protein